MNGGKVYFLTKISIHAAREGGDIDGILLTRYNNHFNPRRP